MKEIHRVRYVRRNEELPNPPRPTASFHFSIQQKLSKSCLFGLYGGFITQARCIKSLSIAYWFALQPLTPPGRSEGWNWKFNPLINGCVSWQPPLILGTSQSPHSHKDTFIILNTWKIPRVSGMWARNCIRKAEYIWKIYFGPLNDQICISYKSRYFTRIFDK